MTQKVALEEIAKKASLQGDRVWEQGSRGEMQGGRSGVAEPGVSEGQGCPRGQGIVPARGSAAGKAVSGRTRLSARKQESFLRVLGNHWRILAGGWLLYFMHLKVTPGTE